MSEMTEDLREWAQMVGGCFPTRSIIDNKLSSVDSRMLDRAGAAIAEAADRIEQLEGALREIAEQATEFEIARAARYGLRPLQHDARDGASHKNNDLSQ